MKYKTLKVFDCQDMPRELCYAFLKLWDNKCNDVYVNWEVGEYFVGTGEDTLDSTGRLVDVWLLENGAADQERVLINYWW